MCVELLGHQVTRASSLTEATQQLDAHTFDLVVTDVDLEGDSGLRLTERIVQKSPSTPVIIVTGMASTQTAVEALRRGAYDFLQKPLESETLQRAVSRALEHAHLRLQVSRLEETQSSQAISSTSIIGRSPALARCVSQASRVADSEIPVLIQGDSGTGKELIAQLVHNRSGRSGRFVAVNCAAIPAQLMESELFGHMKGSFSGARSDRPGLFEQADGGTLFLDEVGELDLELQPKLLRALQEKTVRRIGGTKEISFDTRIVSATNRDLMSEVSEGNFREDLYYRLHVMRVDLPSLNSRGNDTLLLAQHFLRLANERENKQVVGITPQAARRLLMYDWPGNVRELENAIDRAVALAEHDRIVPEDLPDSIRTPEASRLSSATLGERNARNLRPLHIIEKEHIRNVLEATDGNKAEAARILEIDRATLYRKLARMNLEQD